MLKTTFPTVPCDFRPCCYGVVRCIILKKLVHIYQDNAHSNHIATGSKLLKLGCFAFLKTVSYTPSIEGGGGWGTLYIGMEY